MRTASGLTYIDKRIGGGAPVTKGFLILLDYRQSLDNVPRSITMHIAEVLFLSTGQGEAHASLKLCDNWQGDIEREGV